MKKKPSYSDIEFNVSDLDLRKHRLKNKALDKEIKPCMNDLCGIYHPDYKCGYTTTCTYQDKPDLKYKKMWKELKWEIDWNIGDISVYNKMQEIEEKIKE